MIILDTDHITHLQRNTPSSQILRKRMLDCEDEITTSVITLEEQMKGWVARLSRVEISQQVVIYERLIAMFDFFAEWEVVAFSDAAAGEFQRLREQKVRIATSDLKIASIAIVENAILLTANARDFERVPGLKFANWLDA